MVVGSLRPDSFDQLKAFRATRSEWLYSTDASVVAELKKIVKHVGLAISPARKIPNDTGAARDMDGNIAIAPWMRIPVNNMPWNTVFKPDTRNSIMNTVKTDIGIGADSMQFDDPELEFSLLRFQGGDFSPEALSAFRSFCLASGPAQCREFAGDNYDPRTWIRRQSGGSQPDWREFNHQHAADPAWQLWTSFLKNSSRDFVNSVRQYLHSQARPLPLSINVNNPLPVPEKAFLFDATDYLFCEIYKLNVPRALACFHACATAWQLPFVPSIVPLSTVDTQWGIAYAYALGDHPRVPWDVYVPGKERYYGTVSDYGYLFQFVRDNAQYFDGYDEIADVAFVMEENGLTPAPVLNAAMASLDIGATFRFAVVRPDGTPRGNQPAPFPPRLTVTVNGSPDNAPALFPSVPSLTLNGFKASGTHPALKRILRTVTPDPQKIVAVPRFNRTTGTLITHVVDCGNSGAGLNGQHMEILVPKDYWHLVTGIRSALLIRPNGDPLQPTLSIKRDAETMTIRVPLTGMLGWAIFIFRNI